MSEKKELKLGSLFDGSGGFPLSAQMCGITPVWASEVEPYPIAVTTSRFPDMKHLGDVGKINGAEIEPVDIITFGSPCQDMSVAGKREGIKHESNGDETTTRSGLFIEAIRIIKEMRAATNGAYPRYAVWENVLGAFSSNKGEDFRLVIEEFVKVNEPEAVGPEIPKGGWPHADCYVGDGWSIAYRTVDAQYWGVPQRRRRIYLVADFTGGRAGEILFKQEGLRGHPETCRTEREGTSKNAETSLGISDRETADVRTSANSRIAATLYAAYGTKWNGNSGAYNGENFIFEPVDEDASSQLSENQTSHLLGTFLPQKKAESMAWNTEEISPCLHNGACPGFQNAIVIEQDDLSDVVDKNILDDQGGQQITIRTDGKCPTLRAETHGNLPCILDKPCFDAFGFDGYNSSNTGDKAATLGVNCGMSTGRNGVVVCLSSGFKAGQSMAGGIGWKEECAATLSAQASGTEPTVCVKYKLHDDLADEVSYSMQGFGDYKESDCAATLGASHDSDIQNLHVATAYGVDCRNFTENEELYPTLQAKSNGGQSLNYSGAVRTKYIVRRLTPTECCRLQGFPDGWGVPNILADIDEQECKFWQDVRNTHALINGKEEKTYTKEQMLKWRNGLHTDSAEYKMWGNGICLYNALYVMQGIVNMS